MEQDTYWELMDMYLGEGYTEAEAKAIVEKLYKDQAIFVPDSEGVRLCECEDYPCCGH